MASVQEKPVELLDRNSIAQVESGEGKLRVDWADGHQSRFHHIWLRDSCFCPQCGDTWSGRRYLMLTDISPDVAPASAKLDENGNLCITWSGDNHQSLYKADWLRRHCYSAEERERRRFRPILWDAKLIERLPEVNYAEVRASDEVLLHLYGLLRDYGIAFVREVPTGLEDTRDLAQLIGDLDDSGYGEIQYLSSVVDHAGTDVDDIHTESGTYPVTLPTTHPVPPHTDETFRYAHPGIRFLHCVEPNPEGGGHSFMVDGFRVAQDIREQAPQAFELLSTVPQTYNRYIGEHEAVTGGYGRAVDFRGGGRAFCLDVDGELAGFRYHTRATAPMDLPEDLVEPMYAANFELVSRLNDPANQLRFRLEAGDAVIFDNHRVLHAREGFKGRRQLRLFHVEREEFHNRLRVLSRRLGKESADWALPGGALG